MDKGDIRLLILFENLPKMLCKFYDEGPPFPNCKRVKNYINRPRHTKCGGLINCCVLELEELL